MQGVAPDDRGRYFVAVDGGFRAQPALLARIRYAELNLLRDPFERNFDLILCRNVMIYFESGVRSALVRRFYDALRPGGVLFIGSTEALLGTDAAGFERADGNCYRRDAEVARRVA